MFGDVRRLEDCTKAMQGGVVGVFHLAAMSKVMPSMKNVGMSQFCMANNVEGTHNVLRAALAAGTVRKVMYAASSTVYGSNPVPHNENLLPSPQTPYATSKYMGELLMKVRLVCWQAGFRPASPLAGWLAYLAGNASDTVVSQACSNKSSKLS